MIRFLVLAAVLVAPLFAGDWQALFNGRDTTGWSGDPRLWRVEDGVLIGETDDSARKIGANTFLIWQGGEPEDFELEYKACVTGGNNSGVQYRSRVLDAKQWVVGGYQMDLHPDAPYLGMLYEEKGRGIVCQRGQKVDLADKPAITGTLERPEVKLAEWNDYRIVAKGSLLQHYVNGKLAAEIHDNDPQRRTLKGVIALQLHAGPSMKAEFKELRIRLLEETQESSLPAAKLAEPSPQWIWSSKTPKPNERVFFRRELDLKEIPKAASLTLTCDNWHRVWVNGRDLGFASDWSTAQGHDVTKDLKAGHNIIAVEGRNVDGPAGLAVRLRMTMPDGKTIFLVSDEAWRCTGEVAEQWQTAAVDSSWPTAVALARMGDQPWGPVISPEGETSSLPEDVTSNYQIAKDFRMECLYRVPKQYGSWVAMTVDDVGRLYCSDQYGKIYRVTLPQNDGDETQVVATGIPLAGAHGLLWHKGMLYVSVNEGGKPGVYLVADTDHDGLPETPRLLKAFQGNGEHGPHGLAASPDGEWIYLTAGNFTNLPEMDRSLPARVWKEDQLLPRRPDARGHARDRMAPGGWIARFRPDGSRWELFAMGFRNAYDLAFDAQGELFTYDSDMEWDLGTPWYRPTRICHVVPGAEFGWRNGSGVWPEYYEDSMFSQLDIGPGSPTGVLSGRGAKFPAKYQRAIFALDWTYATIHVIHLTPEGEGYRAEREEFLSGSGLPLTDAVIGKDGEMYVLTGGRKTDSALWRIRYVGREPVTPVPFAKRTLALDDASHAWEMLSSNDRLTRYKARLALETKSADEIAALLAKVRERDGWSTIGSALALARVGGKEHRKVILDALGGLEWRHLDLQQKLNWLRTLGLVFARHGAPNEEERQRILTKIDAAFPSNNETLDRELCRMLCYLEAPGIVGRTLALMDISAPTVAPDWLAMAKRNANYGRVVEEMIAHLPPAQPIHYIYCLRVVKGPWSKEERRRFFAWFGRLSQDRGGESYAGFIEDLRKEALSTCTPEERAWIVTLEPSVARSPLKDLPRAKGPGRSWTIEEVAKLASIGLSGRDRDNGRRMFQACLCSTCHRFGGEGGSVGPDLTTSAGRFTARDLAEAILEPSKVISDQYAFDLITKNDGSQIVGKILEEKDQHWIVATSPFDLSQTMEIERSQIKEMKPSPVSPMPAALINQLNPEELKDLLAYLLGGK